MSKKKPSPAKSQSTKKQPGGSAEQLTLQNVQEILQLEKAEKEERTRSELVAEAIANFCGSTTFVWVNVVWFGSWILINSLPGIPHIDPFPFTFLTLAVSLEAIFLSSFILISQNHNTKISERRNHLDLQINLLTEQENTRMIEMLQAIAEKVGADVKPDAHLQAMSERTEPEKVAKQIKAHDES